MELSKLKKLISEAVELLPTEKAVSEREAERRAGRFLEIQAFIVDSIDTLNDNKIRATSLEKAVYAKVLSEVRVKQVTEKKIQTEADPDYQATRENLEDVDARINYLKSYYKIFDNAHIFYRQLSKAEFSGR